jgi:hypothetical protein
MAQETPKARLEGRVASILNARELVINIGSDGGVERGQKFAVLAATPIRVKDPASGAILDEIDREKIRVEAHEVRAKITICRTYRMRGLGGFALTSQAAVLAKLFPAGKAQIETLRADDSEKPPPLSEEQSYVKINDRVVAVDDA